LINKIPVPNRAVVMCDAVDWSPRHKGGNDFLFLDAHVERIALVKYKDPLANEIEHALLRDHDSYGNRPYFGWGLTKTGFDADP
jgi:prepilin-type processing-associated H-X9-DG protein